jgi:hypothetical protein
MDQHLSRRNIGTLWASALGIVYSGLLYQLRTLTGTDKVDGIIGVMLGLYICSRPAANFLDMFFFERGARRQFSPSWSAVSWLAVNILVLLIGWFVIFAGMTRLVGKAD